MTKTVEPTGVVTTHTGPSETVASTTASRLSSAESTDAATDWVLKAAEPADARTGSPSEDQASTTASRLSSTESIDAAPGVQTAEPAGVVTTHIGPSRRETMASIDDIDDVIDGVINMYSRCHRQSPLYCGFRSAGDDGLDSKTFVQ